VRQRTLRQVVEHTERTARQYPLQERAVALGWPRAQIVVVDADQGHSGVSAADRAGFQPLVAAVGLGQVGSVLGLAVSRLARSSADWHRLLEICALPDTRILDEDGRDDPGRFNDRLLLGLKRPASYCTSCCTYDSFRILLAASFEARWCACAGVPPFSPPDATACLPRYRLRTRPPWRQ
jgi:hypothetical protein